MRALAAVAVLVAIGGCGASPGQVYQLGRAISAWPDRETFAEYQRLASQTQKEGEPSPSMTYHVYHCTMIGEGSRVRIIEIEDKGEYQKLWKVFIEQDTTDPITKRQQGKDMTGQIAWISNPEAVKIAK